MTAIPPPTSPQGHLPLLPPVREGEQRTQQGHSGSVGFAGLGFADTAWDSKTLEPKPAKSIWVPRWGQTVPQQALKGAQTSTLGPKCQDPLRCRGQDCWGAGP